MREEAEDGLKKATDKNEKLLKAYSWDAQADVRTARKEAARMTAERHAMQHRVQNVNRQLEEARQDERRLIKRNASRG